MKLKEFLFGLGFRPPAREFAHEIHRFNLTREGEIEFAAWRHPAEKTKDFNQKNVDALREFLAAGDYALDIGAHSGDTALPIALAVGPAGGVIALEPNPYVFKILVVNAGLNNNKTNILPFMFAATATDGAIDFEYSDSGFCNGGLHKGISPWRHAHFFKLRVQGRNLMTFLKREYPNIMPRIRYVKIDAEGYDPDVTHSISELLVSNRPFIKTEIYKHLPTERRVAYFNELHAHGYRLHKWESDGNYRGQVLTKDDVDNWRHYDVFAVPE
ncbi:MAG TPA: FkbM family methyltransferase [Gammaproteobacteria bacterium]|nr:FkbM family methyltransferase [Gammaproteobacteria bacterium]